MKVIPMAALAVLLAPATHAFFWSCPALASDDTVANLTMARAKVDTMFPALVYLKKGDNEEKLYSCITIETFDDYQAPKPAAKSRFLWCLFGCSSNEEKAKAYNATITYYTGGEEKIAYSNISLWEHDSALIVTLTDVPSKLFGEKSGKTKLRLASMGDDYFILIDCNNYFLSFGHTRYAYMLMSAATNMSELMAMDWRCMAQGLEDATETSGIMPGGMCMESGGGGGDARSFGNIGAMTIKTGL